MSSLESRFRETLSHLTPGATLLAVSKTQPIEAIEELYVLGHRDFGENYVQELEAKATELASRGCTEIRWHFLGHLQTNKVKMLIPHVFAVHALDSEKLARELAKRWRESGRPGQLPVFIEVNVDAEATKSGYAPEAVPEAARAIAALPELDLRGLMCIPEPGPDEKARGAFRSLRELEAQCRPYTHGALSMGMSSDYRIALAEGSTHIRVGTALFGPRNAV